MPKFKQYQTAITRRSAVPSFPAHISICTGNNEKSAHPGYYRITCPYLRPTALVALGLVVLFCLAGCLNFPSAPTFNGNPIVIKVKIDDNIQQGMDTVQVERYSQLALWMSENLMEYLQVSGYQAELLDKSSAYKYREGEFLLTVKIERYNFRAVGTLLETSYILAGKEEIISGKHSCSTARNWRHCVKKLNKDMVDAITQKLMSIEAKN